MPILDTVLVSGVTLIGTGIVSLIRLVLRLNERMIRLDEKMIAQSTSQKTSSEEIAKVQLVLRSLEERVTRIEENVKSH